MPESDTIKQVARKSPLSAILVAAGLALGGAAGSGISVFGTGERLARLEERVETVIRTVDKIERKLDEKR